MPLTRSKIAAPHDEKVRKQNLTPPSTSIRLPSQIESTQGRQKRSRHRPQQQHSILLTLLTARFDKNADCFFLLSHQYFVFLFLIAFALREQSSSSNEEMTPDSCKSSEAESESLNELATTVATAMSRPPPVATKPIATTGKSAAKLASLKAALIKQQGKILQNSANSNSSTSAASRQSSSPPSSTKKKTPYKRFVDALAHMVRDLCETESERTSSGTASSDEPLMWWSPDGSTIFFKSVKGHNDLLAEAIRPYFPHGNIMSCRRLMYSYGWIGVKKGPYVYKLCLLSSVPCATLCNSHILFAFVCIYFFHSNKGGFFHPLFQRGGLTSENVELSKCRLYAQFWLCIIVGRLPLFPEYSPTSILFCSCS
jgi:hypothetical protein